MILNRGAGSILPLHIGQRPSIETGEDRVSKSYLEKLEKLPLINEQGDGIKSFAGCLLTSLVMTRFITLLDEPEAFLHPPQARLLGTILASEHNNNQLIIATHSGDLLRGILDANAAGLAAACRDGGYNDWYLPSKYELDLIFKQRFIIGEFSLGEDIYQGVYWSSPKSPLRGRFS